VAPAQCLPYVSLGQVPILEYADECEVICASAGMDAQWVWQQVSIGTTGHPGGV
jgi:hypothetical protein